MLKKITSELRDIFFQTSARIKGQFNRSYAQFGEDLILKSFLEERYANPAYRGFWVDIGAHDPIRFSNTKLFSERGWRGINVDALPSAISRFNKLRARDININVGIGPNEGSLDYYTFKEPAVNTFSKDFAEKTIARSPANFLGVTQVPVITLTTLLNQNLPAGQKIDFFTIDTEGLDLTILQSNDWEQYTPDYVMIEIHSEDGKNDSIPTCRVTKYLRSLGYCFVAQCLCTTLYKHESAK